LGLKSIAMRASLLFIVALAVITGVSFWRSTATGISKTYGLSVALKDGICTADQETRADGVSPFSVPAALNEAVAKIGEPTEQASYDCLGVAIPPPRRKTTSATGRPPAMCFRSSRLGRSITRLMKCETKAGPTSPIQTLSICPSRNSTAMIF
jgi:hypothetical protein